MAAGDAKTLTAKEETLLMAFRVLSSHQQREIIEEMQALVDANNVTREKLKSKKLRPATNEIVRAAYKDIPPLTKPEKRR